MRNILENADDILNQYVPGFHEYILQEPVHLAYVSQNLCEMTGRQPEELLSEEQDLYKQIVHGADIPVYENFIHSLEEKEQTLTTEYRIIDREEGVHFVSDTATSKRLADGTMVAYSVLTDVTPLMKEIKDLKFLNETVPCGFIKYTCDKIPRITYVNERMLNMLRFPNVEDDVQGYLKLCSNNVYMMFPPEDRPKLAEFLEKVYSSSKPLIGEINILRGDGSKGRVFGWITRCKNAKGEDEFQSVLMDVTKDYQIRKANERERYLSALSDVYDKIFECNFRERTVTYVHGHQKSSYGRIKGIPMFLEGATETWVKQTIEAQDAERVQAFFDNIFRTNGKTEDGKPPRIRFYARSQTGEIRHYEGIFLKASSSISLFCIRYVYDNTERDALRIENQALRDNMQQLVRQFTDGMVAFEYQNGNVTPLYGNESAYQFFGYTEAEWKQLYNRPNPAKEFLSRTGIPFEAFEKIIDGGEAEFTYYGTRLKKMQRCKAVCSMKQGDENSPRYIMLYDIKDPEEMAEKSIALPECKPKVSIRTFGYFDVFINDKPVVFRSKKSKELLALLVDRRGGYVTAEEAISILWEDEDVSSVTLARCRKIALRLKNTLEEYGISDIMESVDGRRRIVMDRVQCDLYDYLSPNEEYAQLFKGSYLTNYSWGETTLGELLGDHFN